MGHLSREEQVGLEYRRTALTDAVTLLRGLYERRSMDGVITLVGSVSVLNRERRATQKILDENTVKNPNYEAAWKELISTVQNHAWEPSTVKYEATQMLEWMAQLVEKHGGPTFDEQVYGSK